MEDESLYFLACTDCGEYLLLGDGPPRADYQAAEDVNFYDDIIIELPTFLSKHRNHSLKYLNSLDMSKIDGMHNWINYMEAHNVEGDNHSS